MNEQAGSAGEVSSACQRCGAFHLFEVVFGCLVFFFPLLLFGKPRQPDLSASNFLVPEEIVRS